MPNRSYFVFNGRRSIDFGIIIEEQPESSHAERRGDLYQIAGRNGSCVREDGTFENYEQIYRINTRNIMTGRDAYQTGCGIANWLIGSNGFQRLEDTYEPEYYRLARFSGPLNIESILRLYGRGTLSFDCRPERYLKSGEEAISGLTNVDVSAEPREMRIQNPTGQPAHPIIRISGDGGVGLEIESDAGVFTMTANLSDNTVFFDCETYDVKFEDGSDASRFVRYLDAKGYPTLPTMGSGEIIIRSMQLVTSGVIEKVDVIPRWWSL